MKLVGFDGPRISVIPLASSLPSGTLAYRTFFRITSPKARLHRGFVHQLAAMLCLPAKFGPQNSNHDMV